MGVVLQIAGRRLSSVDDALFHDDVVRVDVGTVHRLQSLLVILVEEVLVTELVDLLVDPCLLYTSDAADE